jgi:hypothetical protein
MNDILDYFGLYLLSITIIWLIGVVVMAPFMQSEKVKSLRFTFFRLLSGILTLTFASAIYFTEGKTIFWLLGIIPIIMLLQKKDKLSIIQLSRNPLDWLPNKYLAMLIPIPFLIQYLNFGPSSSFLPCDIIDYVTTMEFNTIYKRENFFGTLNMFPSVKISEHTPYHYAELWLNHLFSKLYNNNPGKNLLYVTYTTLFLTVLAGFISLFAEKGLKKIWLPLIVVALFMGGPIYWSGISEWFGNVRYLGGSFIIFENFGFFGNTILSAHHAQKHLYFAALFIAVISLKNNKLLSLSLISIFPVINIGLTLGVFSFGVSFFLLNIFRKPFNLREIMVLAIPGTLMVGFYALSNMTNTDAAYSSLLYSGSEEITVKGEIIRAIMRVTHTILFLVLVFSPLLFTYLIARKEIENRGFDLPLFFAVTSLIVPVLSRPILVGFNSAQFLTYLLPALTIVLVFASVETIISKNNWGWKKSLVAIVLLALLSSNAYYLIENNRSKNKLYTDIYNEEYIRKVKLALSETEQVKKIGYVLSEDILIANMIDNWKHQNVGSLAAENNSWGIISLNFPLINHDFKSWLNESYHNHQQFFWDSNSDLDFYDSHLTNFIIENSISHVFIGIDAENKWIKNFETEEIIDKKSGERLILIRGRRNASVN